MTVARKARRIALWTALPLVALTALLSWRVYGVAPTPTGNVLARVKHYRARTEQFDLLFVGDSRTYCAMHPERIDALLGTRSLNLSRWAHWFPTQLPMLQDLLPDVPAGTTVVWSIGHQNFQPVHLEEGINTTYPLHLRNVPAYLSWGYGLGEMRHNLLVYTPLTQIAGRGPQWRGQLEGLSQVEVYRQARARPASPPAGGEAAPAPTPAAGGRRAPTPAQVEAALARWRARPEAASVQVLRAGGGVTSLAVETRRGAYLRVELDPAFFRAKQAAASQTLHAGGAQAAEPKLLQTFRAALDLFQARGVRLIVNELEEAPHQYPTRADLARARRFMQEVVQPEVERRGFAYVRVDLDRLSDAEYFDYNHLNRRGVIAYTPMIAAALRPHLVR